MQGVKRWPETAYVKFVKLVATTVVSSPYIASRYRAFVDINPSIDFTLLEYEVISDEYAWAPSSEDVSYRRLILSEVSIEDLDPSVRNSLIIAALNRLNPDLLVICGYGVIGMLACLQWAKARENPIPVVLLSESQEIDFPRKPWSEYVKSRLVAMCSSALVGGYPHAKYLSNLGMQRDKIFMGYDVVDNAYFENHSRRVRAAADPWLRRLGLSSNYLLCSARFIQKKNLIRLLKAYRIFLDSSKIESCSSPLPNLVILGDGPQRSEIEASIEDLSLVGCVHLPGFRQIDELPAFYALAAAFILPSTTEQWGLVVNEAMASGLPVLVSERCGCASDLVENGVNGYTFDPYNVNEIARMMAQIASPDCDRVAMGEASRVIISRWSPEAFASGLESAVNTAMNDKGRDVGLLDRLLLRALSRR